MLQMLNAERSASVGIEAATGPVRWDGPSIVAVSIGAAGLLCGGYLVAHGQIGTGTSLMAYGPMIGFAVYVATGGKTR